jgi:hypothetical protein
VAGPVFILATEIDSGSGCWAQAEEQASNLAAFATRLLGFAPRVTLAAFPPRPTEDEKLLAQILDREIAQGASEVFVLPVAFELNVWQ